MKKLLVLLLLMLTFSVNASKEDYQIWLPVNTNVRITEHWRGFLELQPRLSDDSTKMGVGIIRPAIGYSIDKNWTIWAGYLAQAESKTGEWEDYHIENRAFQGLTYNKKYDNIVVDVRNRFEERMFSKNSDLGLRWRTRIRGEYLIDNCPFSVIASDEIFINLSDNDNNSIKSGMDQNRAYLGVGYRFNPMLQLETGYLQNHVWGNVNKDDKNNNVWMSNINLNF